MFYDYDAGNKRVFRRNYLQNINIPDYGDGQTWQSLDECHAGLVADAKQQGRFEQHKEPTENVMKKSAKAELRAKSAEDLATLAKTARDTLMKARFSKSVEGKTITIQQREQRRQVARLETMLAEKKFAEKKTVKAGVKS